MQFFNNIMAYKSYHVIFSFFVLFFDGAYILKKYSFILYKIIGCKMESTINGNFNECKPWETGLLNNMNVLHRLKQNLAKY